MGRDKAWLEWGDRTLLEWVATRCAQGAAELVLAVGRLDRDLPPALGAFRRIPDERPGQGPLAGIEALLGAIRTDWLVAMPCDMPWITAEDIGRLRRVVSREAEAKGAVFSVDGHLEPFPMLLHRSARPVLQRLLDEGRREVLGPTAELSFVEVPTAAGQRFRNLNEPGDYERAVKDFATQSLSRHPQGDNGG